MTKILTKSPVIHSNLSTKQSFLWASQRALLSHWPIQSRSSMIDVGHPLFDVVVWPHMLTCVLTPPLLSVDDVS